MKAELVPENGDPPIPIVRDVTVIGRHESCDVVIQAAGLSKRHCVVVKTDGLLVIRDLATTNGTKVKGQRVRWAALCRKTESAWAVTRSGSIWARTRCRRLRSSRRERALGKYTAAGLAGGSRETDRGKCPDGPAARKDEMQALADVERPREHAGGRGRTRFPGRRLRDRRRR